METHAAQDVVMVLMNVGGYELTEGGECAFVVGTKDCLDTAHRMLPTDSNDGGWSDTEMRTWLNDTVYEQIPESLRQIFSKMKVLSVKVSGGADTISEYSEDYLAIPAEKEVFGKNTYGDSNNESQLPYFDWYSTAANRKKKVNGVDSMWWLRTPAIMTFLCVYTSGSQGPDTANIAHGAAPFGCIGKKVIA